MITELVIENNQSLQNGLNVFEQFEASTGIELIERSLIRLNDKGDKVLVYTDLSPEHLRKLTYIFIKNDFDIVSRRNCTFEILRMFKENHIKSFLHSFDYEPKINSKITSFITQSTSKSIKKLAIQCIIKSYQIDRIELFPKN